MRNLRRPSRAWPAANSPPFLPPLLDRILGERLSKLRASGSSYAVVYTAGRPGSAERPKTYEAEFQDPIHMELKRDSSADGGHHAAHTYNNRKASVFEKYLFVQPGTYHAHFRFRRGVVRRRY